MHNHCQLRICRIAYLHELSKHYINSYEDTTIAMTKNNHARRQRQRQEAKLRKVAETTKLPLAVSSGVNTPQERARKRARTRSKRATKEEEEAISREEEEEEEEGGGGGGGGEGGGEEDDGNASEKTMVGMASTTRHVSAASIECDAQSPQQSVVVSKEPWPPCSDDSTHSANLRIPRLQVSLAKRDIGRRDAQNSHSPVVVSKEQWDPGSDASTSTPLSPRVRLSGGLGSQQADAILREHSQPSPLDAITVRGNIDRPSRWRKRPTAADPNDRAEEEYQQRERAKRLATVDIRASVDVARPSPRIDAVSLLFMPQRSLVCSHGNHPSAMQLDKQECEPIDDTNKPRLPKQPDTPLPHNTLKRKGDGLPVETDMEHKKQKLTVPVQPKAHRGPKGGQRLLGRNKGESQYERQEPETRSAASFPRYGSLPDNVKDIILGMLLKSNETLQMKPSWANPTPPYGVTIPTTTLTLIKGPGMVRTQYLQAPHTFQHKLDLFRVNLKHAPHRLRQPGTPSLHGMTLSLLCVSKAVNEKAARMLYTDNMFEFDGNSAWLLLEVFLATIGCRNVGYLQRLRVSAPKWYPNSSVDAISGVLMDSLRPDTSSAQRADPSEDRLFSAIIKCIHMLARSSTLKCLEIKMPRTEVRAFLDFRLEDWRCVLTEAEQANHEKRKNEGVRLFRAMSDALGLGCKPLLVVQVGEKVSWLLKAVEERWFADKLTSLVVEAEKYGWGVAPEMRESKK